MFQEPGEEAIPAPDAVVDLEMDELNQHECMAALTGLIGHMHRNNITPKTEQVSGPRWSRTRSVWSTSADVFAPVSKQEVTPAELPPWMKYLHSKLSKPSTPLNIRLFISKMIINSEEVKLGTNVTF